MSLDREQALDQIVTAAGCAPGCRVDAYGRWLLKESHPENKAPWWRCGDDYHKLLEDAKPATGWVPMRLFDLDTGWSAVIKQQFVPGEAPPC